VFTHKRNVDNIFGFILDANVTLSNIKLAYTIYEHVVTTSKKNIASPLQRGKIFYDPTRERCP